MKKIIATIIRAIMPKAIRKHEEEKRNKHIHNANVMQKLLDNEHDLRDRINAHFGTVYTTKKALRIGYVNDMTDYNSYFALQEADFK